MQKYMRWSAILVALLLVLAACYTGGEGSEEPDESAPAASGRSERRRPGPAPSATPTSSAASRSPRAIRS